MKHYLILDTETTNSTSQPLPYDIGYAICDEYGNIELERSYCVAELFIHNKPLLQTAYYAEKIPTYYEDMKLGVRKMKTLLNIRKQIFEDMRNYGITEVGAYNMNFDKRACNNSVRYETKSLIRWFFPYETEFFCIWNFACNTLCDEDFIKWAIENNFVSEKGNVQTSAEVVYRYITKQVDFVEVHKGLDDVKIETIIFAECNKKDNSADKSVRPNCWQKVQKLRKAMEDSTIA